jgi:accessory colonization factor AcfC
MLKPVMFFIIAVVINSSAVFCQNVINCYGPGGPAPAMKEAAAEFEKESGIKVNITAGPSKDWMEKAKKDADIIFSGSEHMMTDFINEMQGLVTSDDVIPLYLRPSVLLVRPGNPQNIKKFSDLLEKNLKILVVNGAGQTGLWEDMAGKDGDINKLKNIRNKIAFFARNSAEAKNEWIRNEELDVWIIWNIWQKSNPDIAEIVKLEPEYTIYRDCGVVLTKNGKQNQADNFINYLSSQKGKQIFNKWGWITD